MVIQFPTEEEILSPKDAFTAHQHLLDYHLYFLKQQDKCEFFYWEGLRNFFLFSLAFLLLYGQWIVPSPLIGIIGAGVGTLLIFAQHIKMDLEYGVKAAMCIEKGLFIEKKYDYAAKLFNIFDQNREKNYRGNLLSRIFPMGLVALSVVSAGVLLAMKFGIWQASIVAVISIVILAILTNRYITAVRKILMRG